ncbi:hypothetical protein N2152v2_008899 [Parachlorella kessleri]
MAEGTQQFSNISLGTRGGTNQGSLRITPQGLLWKRAGGGRAVEVPTEEIEGLTWSKLARGCMLGVKRNEGPALSFMGFRDKDLDALKEISNTAIKEEPVGVAGWNWGRAQLEGATLTFRVGGDKTAFQVPLPDVTQAQQGKDEVMLEFPIDDTTGDREDCLVGMSFYIPKDNEELAGQGEEDAAKVFFSRVMEHTDAGAATGDAVATFDQVGIIVPRGRFDVEMYMSSLKLVGQAQDYRIQYDSIVRIFLLPKVNAPQTMVVISLDPPIRYVRTLAVECGPGVAAAAASSHNQQWWGRDWKGQTFYPHILCQFPSDEEASVTLDISDEALQAKNDKCGGKLQRSLEGPAHEVFARVLRGLSGKKLTKPGSFRSADGNGSAVKCSYKADDGYVYPLERAFFYVQKPPLLLVFDDIDSLEFMRQAQGITAAKTFDLLVRMKSGVDHLFRGIPRSEWTNLFEFIQAKQLRIENFKEVQRGPGAAPTPYALDDDVDAGLAATGMHDDDEEDEDFDANEEESEDVSGSESEGDAEMVEEAAEPKTKKVAEAKPKAAKKERAPKKEKAPKGEGKAKRAKKDKDAPKRALSAFMFFSNAVRDDVKKENPGVTFGEVGKLIGERWKSLSDEEKKPYQDQAEKDKTRAKKERDAYEGKQKAAKEVDEDEEGSDEAPEPVEDDDDEEEAGDDEDDD